jgi:hypothetical protein
LACDHPDRDLDRLWPRCDADWYLMSLFAGNLAQLTDLPAAGQPCAADIMAFRLVRATTPAALLDFHRALSVVETSLCLAWELDRAYVFQLSNAKRASIVTASHMQPDRIHSQSGPIDFP